MYYLTDNKIEYDGRIFTQIKRKIDDDKFELGGYVEDFTKIKTTKFWIKEGSYVYGDCNIEGHISIDKNVIVKNSTLIGSIILKDNCSVINSRIVTMKIPALFWKNCEIIDRNFKAAGKYDPFYFQDGKIVTDTYNGVILTMTDNYGRVGCLTMTYEAAWQYLHDDEKWNMMKDKYTKSTPEIFYPDTKKWLYYWCEKQLKRKEGRAK